MPTVRNSQSSPARKGLSVAQLAEGVLTGDRAILGRAFSLMESSNTADRSVADELLQSLLPHSGKAIRLGVSGVPGAGKSTFIESLGIYLMDRKHRVAVLAVDPSSEISGGSIMGDKTRMERLATHEKALVRPSPNSGILGGVARGTRESIIVCEAAGYDVVIIETVGTGQAETQVASMVDTFLLLLLAGAGDELQGIKRGVLELADVLAINKADGDNAIRAAAARAECQTALHMMRGTSGWQPPVLACSAIEGTGVSDVWAAIQSHRAHLESSGGLESRRREQAARWFDQALDRALLERLKADPAIVKELGELRRQAADGSITAQKAADRLLEILSGARP